MSVNYRKLVQYLFHSQNAQKSDGRIETSRFVTLISVETGVSGQIAVQILVQMARLGLIRIQKWQPGGFLSSGYYYDIKELNAGETSYVKNAT